MATILERAPGIWEVRVFTGRNAAGRPTQISRTVRGGKCDAQRVAAEFSHKPATADARQSLAALVDLWVEQNESRWAPSTARDIRSRVGMVKADPIAGIPVARLSTADVERWHARLRRGGIQPGSIRNQHNVVRAALSQGLRWGWIVANVAAIARLEQPKRSPRGSMSNDDVRSVLAAAREIGLDAGVAMRLAAVTGARRSELAALRWNDLDGSLLTIEASIAVIRQGTRNERTKPILRADPTKTANRRVVALDDTTVAMLEELRSERAPYGPWILGVGDRPVNPDRVGGWWRLARRRSEIDERWRLHDLRHWSATVAIAQGHNVRSVAWRLGHANPAMTLRVYAHAVQHADAPIAADLASALDGTG